MKLKLYAFFSESSVEKIGSSFWTTLTGKKVRATHVSRDMKLTEFLGPVLDDYGRAVGESPAHLPADILFAGEVWSDSHEYDLDHMDPNLSHSLKKGDS